MTIKRETLTTALLESLRDAAAQMGRLNHAVGGAVALNAVDMECLDVIARHGPITPGELSAIERLPPTTLTGVLDRLEKGGWVERSLDRANRRRIQVTALRTRGRELSDLYRPMAEQMEQLCSGYSDHELELITDFLKHVHAAGSSAAEITAARKRHAEG